jgi:hypothetical protein
LHRLGSVGIDEHSWEGSEDAFAILTGDAAQTAINEFVGRIVKDTVLEGPAGVVLPQFDATPTSTYADLNTVIGNPNVSFQEPGAVQSRAITTKRRIAASRGMRIEKTMPALFGGLVPFPTMPDRTISLPLPASDRGSLNDCPAIAFHSAQALA